MIVERLSRIYLNTLNTKRAIIIQQLRGSNHTVIADICYTGTGCLACHPCGLYIFNPYVTISIQFVYSNLLFVREESNMFAFD